MQALILGFALCKLLVVFGVCLLSGNFHIHSLPSIYILTANYIMLFIGSAHNDYVNVNSRPLHMNSLIMLLGLCSLFIPFVLSASVGEYLWSIYFTLMPISGE